MISAQSAFIAGNDTTCSNGDEADVSVSFISAFPPYSFVYAINGVNQAIIQDVFENPYYIKTKEAGIYTLSYFSDAINIGSTNGAAIVTVLESPRAIFSTDSDTMSILYTTLKLQDLSEGNIVDWQWDFGDGNTSSQQNPYHTYQESLGIYNLSLIVVDDMGCSNTAIKYIWITDDYWMYIPNAFTPDHDGVNDVFCLQHHGIRAETFLFNIYDRFSNLVYATDKIEKLECFLNSNGWDGKHFKTGNDLPMGTYIYEVYFQDFEGWKHQEREHLFIIR